MKLGVVYPQNETHGDPRGVHEIGRAVEDLGYDSSGAFVTMFRKTLGAPPKRFLQERTAGIHAPLNVPSGNFYEYQ